MSINKELTKWIMVRPHNVWKDHLYIYCNPVTTVLWNLFSVEMISELIAITFGSKSSYCWIFYFHIFLFQQRKRYTCKNIQERYTCKISEPLHGWEYLSIDFTYEWQTDTELWCHNLPAHTPHKLWNSTAHSCLMLSWSLRMTFP